MVLDLLKEETRYFDPQKIHRFTDYTLFFVIKLQCNGRITTSKKEAQDMPPFCDIWRFSLPAIPYVLFNIKTQHQSLLEYFEILHLEI